MEEQKKTCPACGKELPHPVLYRCTFILPGLSLSCFLLIMTAALKTRLRITDDISRLPSRWGRLRWFFTATGKAEVFRMKNITDGY